MFRKETKFVVASGSYLNLLTQIAPALHFQSRIRGSHMLPYKARPGSGTRPLCVIGS